MKGGERMYIAVAGGGRVVGFSSLLKNEMRALYVHPDWIRHGIGKRMLRRLEAIVRRRGIGTLTLGATLTAVAFYQKQGYRIVRRRSCRMNGVPVPAIRMKKSLRPKTPAPDR